MVEEKKQVLPKFLIPRHPGPGTPGNDLHHNRLRPKICSQCSTLGVKCFSYAEVPLSSRGYKYNAQGTQKI